MSFLLRRTHSSSSRLVGLPSTSRLLSTPSSTPLVYLESIQTNQNIPQGISLLTLNRPSAKNAISREFLDQLQESVQRARWDTWVSNKDRSSDFTQAFILHVKVVLQGLLSRCNPKQSFFPSKSDEMIRQGITREEQAWPIPRWNGLEEILIMTV